MTIIHTSDIHLDSPLTTRLPQSRARERRRELLSGFGRLVEEAKSLKAEAIIIAGDLFDGERVSKRALDTVLDVIEGADDITFLYLQGNHEGNAPAMSGRRMPSNIRTFGDGWTYHRIGDVTFAGRNDITENMLDELALSTETKNIVILHGELRDRCAAPDVIGKRDAEGKNIDYLALGHYHSYTTDLIDKEMKAVYCGTPEGRGFDEAGDKGYVILSTDGLHKGITHSFKNFAYRRLHIIPLPLDGMTKAGDILESARTLLGHIPDRDLVRLELAGKYYPDLWKDTDALMREFGNRFYYFEVKDSSRIAINPEDYKHDMSLKGEFIRTVSADESLDDITKERIIACGINALMGEDLFDN